MTQYKLNPGNKYNPLSDGKFRNSPCVCNSGLKCKKCCGIKHYISSEQYDSIIKLIEARSKKLLQEIRNAKT